MKLIKTLAAAVGLASVASSALASPSSAQEQAVVVHFNYGSTNLQPIFALEEKLEAAISKAKVGEYDGNEVATSGSDGFLYMYGPNADRLFEVVAPILKSAPFMHRATVKKRYGPPADGTREVTVVLEP